MDQAANYRVNPGLGILLTDAGLHAGNVLRRAELPHDMFARGTVSLAPDQYFALWRAIEGEADDPLLPIHIGQSISVEAFDPLIFAALCSRNLNTAAERASTYKRLIGPMRLIVTPTQQVTSLEVRWPEPLIPPPSLAIAELIFTVALARIATRSDVRPVRVISPHPPKETSAYREYLGVAITKGSGYRVDFLAADAARPFLTVNEPMWETFEPQLRTRLAQLQTEATTAQRVRVALLEFLPTGSSSMKTVAGQLAMSTRTLQRQLLSEGTTFQSVLHDTRESLARHYLKQDHLDTPEIAFLLGYDDPSSFYRAFRTWTGLTPQGA
ncbi:MAG: AraC family transcriptional regulator ligand-binding domain-containing protein, partial [Candidatus Nanopelagicales bacterium]